LDPVGFVILASFCVFFNLLCMNFFMFFPHLQMLINVNINDDNDDDKKVVMAR